MNKDVVCICRGRIYEKEVIPVICVIMDFKSTMISETKAKKLLNGITYMWHLNNRIHKIEQNGSFQGDGN